MNQRADSTNCGGIDVREFEDLVKKVVTRSDIIDIFSKIAQQDPIPWNAFKNWFDTQQPNSRDPHETFTDLDLTWKGETVSLKQFEDYIFSPLHNNIFVKKEDDMAQDITKYYIATSYSSGGSEVGVSEYKDILMKGCRCIECMKLTETHSLTYYQWIAVKDPKELQNYPIAMEIAYKKL